MAVSARYIVHSNAAMRSGWVLKRVVSAAWASNVNVYCHIRSVSGSPSTGGSFTLDVQRIKSPLADRSTDSNWTNITDSGSSTQLAFGSSAGSTFGTIVLTSSDWGGAMPDLGLRLLTTISLSGGTTPTFDMDLVVMAWKD